MSRRVLVVDDDRQMVKTIRAILDHRGWESIPADSGEESVAHLDRLSHGRPT